MFSCQLFVPPLGVLVVIFAAVSVAAKVLKPTLSTRRQYHAAVYADPVKYCVKMSFNPCVVVRLSNSSIHLMFPSLSRASNFQ